MTPSEQLNRTFEEHWLKPALVTDDRTFNFSELYSLAVSIRDWLVSLGCKPGDTVALRLPNGHAFATAYLACILGRYRLVPVNVELNQDDQLSILGRVAAKIVVEDEAILLALHPAEASKPAFDFPVNGVVAVFFTSGTTGRNKGVCHTLEALVGNAIAFNHSQGLGSDTRLYHILPMAYMAGFLNTLLSPWLAGGAVLLGPRFRPVEAFQFWQRPLEWEANAIWLTPTLATVLVRMNRDPQISTKIGNKFLHVFCGTAPLPTSVRDNFKNTFGCCLQESYGMSEVLLVSAQTQVEAGNQINVGRLLNGVQVSFRTELESGAAELVINTPYALKTYLLEDSEMSPLLTDGGMPSGDVGEMVDGALVITGRLKDLIIRGGLNVSPVAVENVLMREDGVQEVAVVGLPHDFWGESIVACIVADPDVEAETLQSSIIQRCLRELGEGMRPDRYVWLDSLPRATTGKVQKHVLAQSFG